MAVQNNPDLFAEVCKSLEVKPSSLTVMLRRNTRRLTTHDVIMRIAKKTGMRPSQIEEQRQVSNNAA